MKCARCPLYTSWNNEYDSGESCVLFGDSWDSIFQYEDKEGNIVGCYIDRHFIENTDKEYQQNLLKLYPQDEDFEDCEDLEDLFDYLTSYPQDYHDRHIDPYKEWSD